MVFENNDEVNKAYQGGRCDVITLDQSALYAARVKLDDPDDHVVLPEVVTKEPLGPVVRQGDNEWADVVRWSLLRHGARRGVRAHQRQHRRDEGVDREPRHQAIP